MHLGPESVRHYVNHARKFYDWCVAEGILPVNPARGLPVPRAPRLMPRPISEERLFYALSTATPRVRPWLVLAAWCGLRACEIAGLRRENVLDRASPPTLIVAHDATKGTSERTVPLSSFVLAELRTAGLPGSGFVFRRRDGLRGPNKAWTVSHECNDHLHASGIPETLHQLRHRFGTQAYRQKHDVLMVGRLMGHKDPRSTAGYADHDKAEAVEVVESLPSPARLRVVHDNPGA
jgi:integrase/recombinase XerC